MKVTILGCGGAGGVPLIGNDWGACDPHEPRNRRTRVSIKIEEGGKTFLVDMSPDMRDQLLKVGLTDLDAVFFTHGHADHTHGIDDLRSINWLTDHSIPIYADALTMDSLRRRFDYIFATPPAEARFVRPSVEPHVIDGPLQMGTVNVTTFLQQHGKTHSLGYRFNDFGYTTDANELDDAAFEALRGVKVWVVGTIRERPHPAHAHFEKTLEWIERVAPERAYLTHMDQSMDYATLLKKLPQGVEPAYDGLEIEC